MKNIFYWAAISLAIFTATPASAQIKAEFKGQKIAKKDRHLFQGFQQNADNKSIYIGKKPVSNAEYLKFVKYVCDSVCHVTLGHTMENPSSVMEVDWSQELDFSPAGHLSGVQAEEIPYGKKKKLGIIAPEHLVYDYKKGHSGVPIVPNNPKPIGIYPDIYNVDLLDKPVGGINKDQALAYCHWQMVQFRNAGYRCDVKPILKDGSFSISIE
jgi:formylglycine-generating enzyme required for sulfatase activity